MNNRHFCPTCGVQRPAVNRQCVICGSPVRLTSHQRAADTTETAWNLSTFMPSEQQRPRSEQSVAA